jgi:hypothetical protein
MRDDCLIVRAFSRPTIVASCDSRDWDILIRQARRGDVLARLYVVLQQHQLLTKVPEAANNHLLSAWGLAQKHERVLRWEVNRIQHALNETGIPIVLLKGAAYLMQNLPAARGRFYADIDIMVPKESLPVVERALLIHGWMTVKLDAYDQRYYRKWMHEIPPMRHRRRQTVIDVHHRILPETTRAQPDATKLLDASIPVDGNESLRTLAPVDMVLHSATHLFYEGELDHGLRDLLDLHELFLTFGDDENFWYKLAERAQELELTRPLYYALRYTHGFLKTPIPLQVMRQVEAEGPNRLLLSLMDALYKRALVPAHPSCDLYLTGLARWLLYIRGHYLRMPIYLLIPHLMRKAFIKEKEDK